MKRIAKKFFILFMCVFIVTNSAVVSETRAEALSATLAAIVSGAGSAAAVLGPVLLGVAIIYAGYVIYQRRDAIEEAFTNWYQSASSTVKSWIDQTSSKIDSGEITDGDTLTIPQDVLNQSAGFVREYAQDYADNNPDKMIMSNSSVIHAAQLADIVSSQKLKALLMTASMTTNAPALVVRNKLTFEEAVIFAPSGVPSSTVLTIKNGDYLFLSNATQSYFMSGEMRDYNQLNNSTSIYQYRYFSTSGTYDSATNDYTSATQWNNSENYLQCGSQKLVGVSLSLLGSYIVSNVAAYPYEIKVMYPVNGTCVLFDGHAVLNYKVVPNITDNVVAHDAGTVIDFPLVPSDYTYTPTYFTDTNGVTGVEVELTQDKLDAIYDYVVDKSIDEVEYTKVIDKEGVKEVDTSKDILDVLTDLPGTITDAVEDALAWLFVPDKAKVDAFVLEAKATIEGNGNLFTYPIELVIRFLSQVYQLGTTDCILVMPRMEFKGYVLYDGSQFNFTDFVERSEFNSIYGYYKTITDFIMIIAVLNLAIKKGSEIIRGN